METLCFQSFSEPTEKPWGTIFYNPNLLERHDANHAEVVEPSLSNSILPEINEFYSAKKIPSRLNYYDPDGNSSFRETLIQSDFVNVDKNEKTTFMKLETAISLTALLNDSDDNLRVSFSPSLIFDSPIGEDVKTILLAEWPYQNLVSHPFYYYFILYDQSEPVSILSFYLSEQFNLARLDDVVTPEKHRKKGYATFLLKFASNWVQDNEFKPYLFVTNPVAKRVYEEVGFEEVFACEKCHWLKE